MTQQERKKEMQFFKTEWTKGAGTFCIIGQNKASLSRNYKMLTIWS